MKFPSSLLLNFTKSITHKPKFSWILQSLLQDQISISYVSKFLWFEQKVTANNRNIFKTPSKFTILHSTEPYLLTLQKSQQLFSQKIHKPNKELKRKLLHHNSLEVQIFDYLTYSDLAINSKKFFKLINDNRNTKPQLQPNRKALLLKFDLVFFKKERLYTKLKYSRVPQYDAVSGGSAALLAGFLGYLITEKFGLELTDSGDFWFLLIYLLVLGFSIKPLLRLVTEEEKPISVLRLVAVMDFYLTIGALLRTYFYRKWQNTFK